MTKILGIVNVTRDSFSDGGRYLDPAAAVAHACQMLADGADIIDIGAESTHPDAEPVPADVEIERLTPVITALKSDGVNVSVDTCKPAVMRHVLAMEVDFINDVTALKSPGAEEAVRDSNANLILMHAIRSTVGCDRAAAERSQDLEVTGAALTRPSHADGRAVRQEVAADAIVATIVSYFERRTAELGAVGIARERLILDPGMGFFLSTRPEPSLAVLRNLADVRSLGCPILVCTSRKSFVGALLSEAGLPRTVTGRGPGTLASELWAAAQGVEYIRTHDVRALRDALRIWSAIQTAGADVDFSAGASSRCDKRA